MKKIIFAGLTVATLGLIGVSVYADTVVNSSQIPSGYPGTITSPIQGTSGIITVSSKSAPVSVNTPSDIGIDESKLSKMTEVEKQKYIEEKLRTYAIKHSGNMNIQSGIISGSGTMMTSGVTSLEQLPNIGTGGIIISTGSIVNLGVDTSKFKKMTEVEKQKYIETLLSGNIKTSTSGQMHTITVSSDGSGITASGVLEPIKISSKNGKKKQIPKKMRVKKNN